ncbi:MAG: hypothetical protein J6R80_03435 [Kiritimatiellae bacterium]|jgi:predicted secreted protein|nr:hypothetical protein [Kiritimatiellia bacterium]
MKIFFAAAALAALVCGCEGIGYRVVANPGENQVMRVVSGDRIYFSLPEIRESGYIWDYTSDDSDVSVTIDRDESLNRDKSLSSSLEANVRIRVHRGYDGPSTVNFFLRHKSGKESPIKEFTITLYKRTGDVAFWE